MQRLLPPWKDVIVAATLANAIQFTKTFPEVDILRFSLLES